MTFTKKHKKLILVKLRKNTSLYLSVCAYFVNNNFSGELPIDDFMKCYTNVDSSIAVRRLESEYMRIDRKANAVPANNSEVHSEPVSRCSTPVIRPMRCSFSPIGSIDNTITCTGVQSNTTLLDVTTTLLIVAQQHNMIDHQLRIIQRIKTYPESRIINILTNIFMRYPEHRPAVSEYVKAAINYPKPGCSNPQLSIMVNDYMHITDVETFVEFPRELIDLMVQDRNIIVSSHTVAKIAMVYPDAVHCKYPALSTSHLSHVQKLLADKGINDPVLDRELVSRRLLDDETLTADDTTWIQVITGIVRDPSRTLVQKQNTTPLWVTAKLIERGYVQIRNRRYYEDYSASEFIWDGAGGNSWNKLRELPQWRGMNRISVRNGVGYDAGGLSRAMYWDIGRELQETCFTNHEGYLMPRTDLDRSVAIDIGVLIVRCVSGYSHVTGLDIHPVVYYFCSARQYLNRASWKVLEFSLGKELISLLAPATAYKFSTEMNDTGDSDVATEFDAEICERYSAYIPTIQTLSKSCRIMMGIREISLLPMLTTTAYVRGNQIVLQGAGSLSDKLHVTGERSAEYRTAFIAILLSWNEKQVTELYRFWFGSPRPQFQDITPSILVCSNIGLAQAATCSYTLRVPLLACDSNTLQTELESCLQRTLAEQAAAEASHQSLDFTLA